MSKESVSVSFDISVVLPRLLIGEELFVETCGGNLVIVRGSRGKVARYPLPPLSNKVEPFKNRIRYSKLKFPPFPQPESGLVNFE